MRVDTIVVITALSMDLCRLRKEVLVQSDFIHKDLLPERLNVVDEVELVRFDGLPARRQRLIKAIVITQVKLDSELGRTILDANLGRYDDLRIVQRLNQLLRDVISLRLQLHVDVAEIT